MTIFKHLAVLGEETLPIHSRLRTPVIKSWLRGQ